MDADSNERRNDAQPVDEAAATDLKIEGGLVASAQARGDDGGRRRERKVRRDGRDDKAIDVIGRESGPVEGDARGRECEVAGGLGRSRNVALLDPRPGRDPFIVRIERSFEIGVGENPVGYVMPDARDPNAICL